MPSGPPPGFPLILATLAQILAAMVAILLARKRAEHRVMAAFLSLVTVSNLVLFGFILSGAPVTLPLVPLVGTARLIFHIRQSFYLVWSFGMMALYTAIFAENRNKLWIFGVAYLLTLATFIVGYPGIGGLALQRAYLLVELAGILVAVGMLVQWLWKRRSPSITHGTAIMLLFCEVAVLVGPWQRDIFQSWDMARVMYCFTYLVLVIMQGGVLWRLSRSS